MTVAEMLQRISSAEITEWAAYYMLEPFGEDRADLRSGIIASTVANVNRAEKQEPYTPHDFMPKFDEQEEPPEDEPEDTEQWRELLHRVEAINMAFGGRDVRHTRPTGE